MKLQRTTLVLLLFALGMSGFVYFHEIRGANQQEELKTKEQKIFAFKADEVQSLTIKIKDQTIFITRPEKANYKWLMKSPSLVPASDASVSYLMDLLVGGKSDRIFTTSARLRQQYGLEQPQAIIEIELKNRQNHQLTLGKHDFNRRFLYAQADAVPTPSGTVKVLLVPVDFENAVNRKMSEWTQTETGIEPTSTTTPTPSASKPTTTPTANPTPSASKPTATPTSNANKPTTTPNPTPSASKPTATPNKNSK